ncbi:conserved exported hypothetical protein [Tenacibaculum sp. 190524A02b]|uniref:Fibronectin type-III domain-containing protein n=1 Tax=Tenacibaculum vairaonense TaxID=3137860 RepID=A0ABP1F6T8_9FLAO
MRNLFGKIVVLIITLMAVSCSNDEGTAVINYERSFTTKEVTDFFINRDGTVDLTVTGAYKDTDPNSTVSEKGFVYGLAPKPEVGANNTALAGGSADSNVVSVLKNLEKGKLYYVRGYFKMSNGSFLYGEEIQASTDVNASTTRTLVMVMEPEPFWRSTTEMTPELKVTEISKESPTELGFEYSLNADFSDSKIWLVRGINGLDIGNVKVRKYSDVLNNLTPATKYYFRPYAKYADGTISQGGTSTAELSTN